ncbi:MAG: phosphate ABC transporter ATP-binding protein [candidate division Zixibacteria bacterium SM1_73]|nr:MAG: phosphate ABC transporter ATP-binding protein [candidate division Zixibacteria bacterium SM1_73]
MALYYMDKIVTKALSLFYGEKRILKEIDLKIPQNNITAIIGPSGCGKSSLLRCMNRLNDLIPESRIEGQILFDGKDLYAENTDVVEIRRRIGMVFQRPNPFPKSVYDNIAYGLRINGIKNKKKLSEIVEKSLKDSGLWEEVKHQLNTSAMELSGGQQQRLCIARALAIEPEVILMDEPCSALDPAGTFKIEELMIKLKQQYTIIIVTHNMQQAARVSDFTGFLYLGQLIEFGHTNQIFTIPEHKLTENYITGRFG